MEQWWAWDLVQEGRRWPWRGAWLGGHGEGGNTDAWGSVQLAIAYTVFWFLSEIESEVTSHE